MMELLVLCIGNRDGGDDAIGPYLYDRIIRERINIPVIDAGTTPENYTAVVKRFKPATLVLVDAVDMGLPPGTIRIIPKEKIGTMHLTTHGIPLSVFITYLEREVKHIVIIGIQPEKMSGPLSHAVKQSGTHLVSILMKRTIEQIEPLS